VPLIAASVMSKKLAVDSDLILLDVKAGSGAFMKEGTRARDLAEACRALARGEGHPCGVAITDMSQPLGEAIGNALDIIEAVEVLRGARHGRLRDLSIWFAARALEGAEGIPFDEASSRAAAALEDGTASERFARMIEAQGGDPRVTEDPASILPRAPLVLPLLADRTGILATIDAEAIGVASSTLGAGRVRKGEQVDPAVGIVFRPKIGDRIDAGEPIGEIHARSQDAAKQAAARTLASMTVAGVPVEPPPLIHDWFPSDGGG
jgi:thymidine phosphorylase